MLHLHNTVPGVQPRLETYVNQRYQLALPRRAIRISRWRSGMAWFTVAALLLPSVALIPETDLDLPSDVSHHDHATIHSGAHGATVRHEHAQYSDIPGSPTHPVNHDCVPCQVIKYLSTSFLPPAKTVAVGLKPDYLPPTDGQRRAPNVDYVASLPPIRAPPHLPV